MVVISSSVYDKTFYGRYLNIETQKKKVFKFKNEVVHIRGMWKMLIMLDIFSLGLNLVMLTMYFK